MSSVRIPDANGFFEIKKNPISKVGVYPYLGRSIGAPEPDRVYMVYRPAEELSDPETIDSFRLMPFVDDHTMLGHGATPVSRKGAHGTLGDNIVFEGDTLYGNLKVWSPDKTSADKRELSCAYRCTYEFTSGTFQGVNYDVIQRKLRGNHIALVKQGRMGPDVAVLDHMTITADAREFEPMDKELTDALDGINASLKAVTELAQSAKDAADKLAADAAAKEKEAADAAEAAAKAKEAEESKGKEPAALDAATVTKMVADAVASALDAKAKTDAEAKPAMDAKELMQAVAKRDELAKRVIPHIGTFDYSDKDETEVAGYALDKLGIKDVPPAAQVIALDSWLKAKPAPGPTVKTGEPKAGGAVAKYISGE